MKNSLFSLCALILLVMTAPSMAQEPEPCDSCAGYPAGAYMRSGGPELGGAVYHLSCQSGTWEDLNGGACIFPTNCDIIGDTCDDGSIYAGLSPDGDMPMYTTPADAPSTYTWNDGTSNYTDMAMVNCTDPSPGTAATCQTGEANTLFLVEATGEPDYPYAAAEYCNGLTAHGYDDWYLPAQDELQILFDNRASIGGFPNPGSYQPNEFYWSSSEGPNNYEAVAAYFGWDGGSGQHHAKDDTKSVRCVRR